MAQQLTQEPVAKVAAIDELQNLNLDATFVVGAEASNIINVAVQLKTDKGRQNLGSGRNVLAYLADAATGAAVVASAPSGGFASGTFGSTIVEIVADKVALITTDANGKFDLNITEVGVKTCYLVVVMPNGRIVVSGAITFA